jgi:Glycosyltransferase like family
MIAFGSSITDTDAYARYAEVGIRHVAEPDSENYAFASVGTFSRTYNLILDRVASREGLEALVLVHPRMEITDPRFCEKVRRALHDPEIAVAGAVGATGIRSIAWWEGEVSAAPVTHRYTDHGGGALPAFEWARPEWPAGGEVDAVDGFLLVLAPWAVRNVRFDESLVLNHGFDVDYCLQIRSHGRKVVTADFQAVQHRSLEVLSDPDIWVEAHIELARKWGGRMPGLPAWQSWKERARRAEAEREAARARAVAATLDWDARMGGLERRLAAATSSVSWRITEPLRRLNRWRRGRPSG